MLARTLLSSLFPLCLQLSTVQSDKQLILAPVTRAFIEIKRYLVQEGQRVAFSKDLAISQRAMDELRRSRSTVKNTVLSHKVSALE